MTYSQKKRKKWEDHYSRKAKKENFPARSVFKLQEIQKKFRIIKKGDCVLDLGCSPGSWLLYAAKLAGPEGFVVGVDLKPVEVDLPSNITVITGDVSQDGVDLLKPIGKHYDVIISDMAPATTGRKDLDAYRSFSLCTDALEIARAFLVPGGCFVCKIFQGEDFKTFANDIKNMFRIGKNFKPQSSRKASKEIYVIGIGRI